MRRPTEEVEGIFPIEEMNHARALAWDVAFLAGSLGDPVQMYVMGRVAA